MSAGHVLGRLIWSLLLGGVVSMLLSPLLAIGVLFVVVAVQVGRRTADRLTPFTATCWLVGSVVGWGLGIALLGAA